MPTRRGARATAASRWHRCRGPPMATQHPGSEPGSQAGSGVSTAAATGGLDAAVAALRERGAHRADPVRFRFIEALARRAEGQPPAVRQRLDATLARALAEYLERYGGSPADPEPTGGATERPGPGP